MNTGVASRRYAKALLAYAKADGKEEQVYEEVKMLAASYADVPGLRRAIENPVLDAEKKLDLLREAAGGKDVSKELMRFFNLVLDRKREKLFIFISFSFIDLYREVKHIRLGKLITAVPVAPEVEKRLRTLREYSNNANIEHLEFETNVDPSLIGGFIFQVGSNRIDASIAGQLKRVKKQFIEKNRRIV